MKIKIRLLFIIGPLIFLVFSCSGIVEGNEEKKFDKFPVEYKLEYGDKTNFKSGNGFILNLDTTLISRIVEMPKNNWLEINKPNFIKKIFPHGGKVGELAGMMSFGLRKDTIWAYDMTQRKVSLRHINDSNFVKDFSLNDWYYSVSMLPNMKLLATGGENLTSRLRKINLITKQTENEYVEFPKAPEGIPLDAWRFANESFLFYSEKHDVAALASRYTDKVTFVNLKNNSSKTFFGPELYNPEFDIVQNKKNSFISVRNDKTRFAFNGYGSVTDDYLYLLYSGESHLSKNLSYGKYVFVYSWDGKPKAKIELPEVADGIFVHDDGVMYVSFPSKKAIYKYVINL